MSARFNILPADADVVDLLQKELRLPHFIAVTLAARGITTVAEARTFMSPTLERDWRDPYIIPGMRDVVDSLERAVKNGAKILVFGDFDLDGISATTVMSRGLRELGATVTAFIPNRSEEGYGLSAVAIDRFMAVGAPEVVITVDCGIACREEVKLLQHRGVEVLITDHHEPADLVPEGVPVCDPKLDPDCPCSILAGVGVALKLIQALGSRFGQPHLWREYTDFATLGTVADLMPMLEDNRALVADGVARMNDNPRPCIAALLQSSGAADKPVAATSLSFSLIPRLNAAGRMGDAQLALGLLMTDDFEVASHKAADLEAVNDQRRVIEAELSETALVQAEEAYSGQRAVVVAGDGWHEGVKGIVASRLVRTYGVPALLFTIDEDGSARGSGRSVGQVNLFKAVESCSDILTRFGGHEAAVGVTLPADKLEEFRTRLCAYLDRLPEDNFHPRVDVDACVRLDELTLENVAKMDMLAPFGQMNKKPTFLARNVMLTRCRAVGAEKNHFSCSLTDGVNQVAGIMFHCSDIELLMHCDSVVNAAFEVQIDEWRGRKSVKAMLSSLAPTKPCVALEACLEPESTTFVADLYAASDAELCADCSEQPEDVESYECAREKNRACWEKKAQSDPEGLRDAIVRAFIGESNLFDSQRQVLDALDEGRSSLAVMATGRGKSLTFQVHAACRALLRHEASLFVYPLRALIADQAFHINEALEAFGITSVVLTGESTPEERRSIFAGLEDGSVDIVLTTPEFIGFHVGAFARCKRISFAVIDEAHHIGLAKAGNRTAYARLGESLSALEPLTVLALTATADKAIAADITEALHIDNVVLDRASRQNLLLDDQRNCRQRESYLANLVAKGQKMVIYVNSRAASVALARTLRKQVPQMAPLIGFYNAGLTRSERKRVESLFRTDGLLVLVATSAFGEGVNIPNIRHVVLYHMPFNEVEFNQMSGRVGRDGDAATIHLLFGRTDAEINDNLLRDTTPDHDCMACVYRQLRSRQSSCADDFFAFSIADLARTCSAMPPVHEITPSNVKCAVAVFRELGLVETHHAAADADEGHSSIRVTQIESKVELTDSVRYREGLDEIEIFHSFKAWVMESDAGILQRRLCRPILPDEDDAADVKRGK